MQDTRNITELLADWRRGWALEQRFYTDSDIYQLELEKLLFANWFMAGHESQLPENGDFIVARMDKESAIIVRGSDGQLKAFANVCRHRGSLVCLEDQGSVRKFECPYHGWMYDIDGNLTAARSMPDDFDKSSHGLKTLPIDVIGGMIFLSFNQNPPSFENAKRDLAEPMKTYGFDNLKVAAKKSYPIAANWKLAIENYMECYHCATAHPEYAKMHTLMLDPARRERLQEKMREREASCGLGYKEVTFTDCSAPPGQSGYCYWRTALFDGYKTGSEDGEPVAPLLGELTDWDGGGTDWVFGPFTYILSYSDHHVVYVFRATDQSNSVCDVYWLVRGDAEEGKDYDVDRVTWLWDVTTQSDKEIITNNWKGVQSRFYEPGPFSKMEDSAAEYTRWIVRELGGAQ